MSMLVSFVLSFFPRDVLDEILNLIGSVSVGFPSYSCTTSMEFYKLFFLLLNVNSILFNVMYLTQEQKHVYSLQ